MAELSPITAASADDNPSPDGEGLVRISDEENYKPTPEQNYELEELVNVMTNGRAHVSTGNQKGGNAPMRHQIRFGTRINDGVGGVPTSPESEQQQRHLHEQQQSAHDNEDDYYYYDDYAGNYKTHPGANGGKVATTGGAQGRRVPGQSQSGAGAGENGDDDDSKVAYVVEGRNYRKYRVEERTDDGFIVGEYGVVDHNDGNLRGVRYTADSTINPSLIQKALLTFLKLK